MNIEEALDKGKGTIVDVRSAEEFNGGNAIGSVNIPLQELSNRLDEIKALEQPLILCCASGNRSGMAAQLLSQTGVDCGNAGSWIEVQHYLQKA